MYLDKSPLPTKNKLMIILLFISLVVFSIWNAQIWKFCYYSKLWTNLYLRNLTRLQLDLCSLISVMIQMEENSVKYWLVHVWLHEPYFMQHPHLWKKKLQRTISSYHCPKQLHLIDSCVFSLSISTFSLYCPMVFVEPRTGPLLCWLQALHCCSFIGLVC